MQEKSKYDKWKEQQKKAIKDNTVKALEPQIQGILDDNKNQIRVLKEHHQQEIEVMRHSIREDYDLRNQNSILDIQNDFDIKIKNYIQENEQINRKQMERMEDHFY